MWQDPIVEEIRQIRQTHAAQFGYDLKAIYKALKKQEEQSGRVKISFAPRRIPVVSEIGHGDYTAERHPRLDKYTVQDIVQQIRERRDSDQE